MRAGMETTWHKIPTNYPKQRRKSDEEAGRKSGLRLNLTRPFRLV